MFPHLSCTHLVGLTMGLQGVTTAWLSLSLSPDWCGGACPYVPAVHAGCLRELHEGWSLQCMLMCPCDESL